MVAKATESAGTEEKEFNFEEWLREGFQGLRASLRCRPPGLPEEFKMHTRAARKEMLLAVRSLLDSAIRELEETPEPATKK
jgi:hypothetical protein